MQTVAHYFRPAEAHVPLSRLQSAGIRATLRDESTLQMNWLWSHAMGGVKIDVPDEDYDAALEILELEPSENSILACPKCGSSDITVQTMSPINALGILIVNAILPTRKVKLNCRACRHKFKVDRVVGFDTIRRT